MENTIEKLLQSTISDALEKVVETQYLSYDPFDALVSPLLNRISQHSNFLKRVFVKVNKESPYNFRKILGIQKRVYANGISHVISARVLLKKAGWKPFDEETLRKEIDIMLSLAIRRETGRAWGLNYPYASRFVNADSSTPNLFTTLNCSTALLDAYSIIKDDRFVGLAEEAASFVIKELGYVIEEPVLWFRYYPQQQIPIYNVNALVAGFFSDLFFYTRKEFYEDYARKAADFVCQHQNSDGSWYYARHSEGEWIDGFHSGYVLEGLLRVFKLFPSLQLEMCLKKGLQYYTHNFFTKNFVPKYYHYTLWPLDAQNCAQALQTLVIMTDIDQACFDMACKVFLVVRDLLYCEKEKYFICSRRKHVVNSLYSLRWSQAPMLLAMAHLLSKIYENSNDYHKKITI